MDESRRDLIKKSAVAGGIVWASPVIQSMSSRAFAAGTPEPTTSSTEPQTTCPEGAEQSCGPSGCGTFTPGLEVCTCVTGVAGTCEHVVFPSADCADYQPCGPAPGYACDTGFRCITACCCNLGLPPFCAPACPTSGRVAVGASTGPPGLQP